jgi:hypothetical protein
MLDMLRKFKVPVGLNEVERQLIVDYFDEKDKKKKKGWFSGFRRKQEFDPNDGLLNDHSKVFYLMGPDNKFLAFYRLDIDTNELVSNIMEDIS